MRFVIQIEGIVIYPVRAGPAVMPRSSQKTASHLVPPLGSAFVNPPLLAVRVIERRRLRPDDFIRKSCRAATDAYIVPYYPAIFNL